MLLLLLLLLPGLPDFCWYVIPKPEKIYQIDTKCYEWSFSNVLKIFQMAINYTYIFQSKALQNFPKLGFFGLKTNHLATLSMSSFLDGLSTDAATAALPQS
jgi:hypothetical protein